MKFGRRNVFLLAAILACPLPASAQQGNGPTDVRASVEAVIGAIKIVLIDLQNELVRLNVPPLSSTDIQLQTSYTMSADGGFDWYVISAEAAYQTTNIQIISIVLEPPPPHTEIPVSATPVLADTLKEILLKAAEGIDWALSSDVPLVATKLSAEVQFVVDHTAEAGGRFRLLPVALGVSAGIHNAAAQRIVLTFGE